MRGKIRDNIERVFYTNLEFPIGCQNRNILATSKILSDAGITDINSICDLATVIEQNSGLEITEQDFDIIYSKYRKLIRNSIIKNLLEYV